MAFLGSDGQPTGAGAFVQARHRQARIGLAALTSLAWLGGCSNYHSRGPEAWWHESIGGKISQQRPPPPGDNDPYPNLATVPHAPAKPDTAAWNRMTAGLITDRINAREAAALAPIPPASSGPPARASLSGPSALSPLDSGPPRGADQPASAALTGATPPPAAPGKARQAARPATQPLPGDIPPPPVMPTVAGEAALVAGGNLPPLPAQEPVRPGIAPPPPPPLVPVTVAAPSPPPEVGDEVNFSLGSTALSDPALSEVKAIASARGEHGIAVTGYGDATSSDAAGQSDALGLGLSRAQALATALVAQGVPYARLRVNAEAAGRGATLRLLQ
jgi:outer membrane protein OmpA-like peptidoglycan-associated protein